jgi:hypothetical protein
MDCLEDWVRSGFLGIQSLIDTFIIRRVTGTDNVILTPSV